MHRTIEKRRSEWKSFSDVWADTAKYYSNFTALNDDYTNVNLSYSEMYEKIKLFATGLQSIGITKGDHISLFSENNAKWMVADQGLLRCGAVNAVRGSQAPIEELAYIYKQSDSIAIIVETPALLNKLLLHLEDQVVKFAICLTGDTSSVKDNHAFQVYSFEEILQKGENAEFTTVEIDKDDLATLIYSSGTTGEPKGIMLSHGNIISQLTAVNEFIQAKQGLVALNILPIWHSYERTCEYYLLSRGCTLNYTNLRNFKKDFKDYAPNVLISVPRIWESIYDGILTEIKKKIYLNRNYLKVA